MRLHGAFIILILLVIPVVMSQPVNLPPKADAGEDKTVIVNETVIFDGSSSSDPDNDSLTYSWDFDLGNGIQSDATGMIVSHVYTTPGRYTVTLTVSDNVFTDRDIANVTVTTPLNNPPNAQIDSPRNGQVFRIGESILFDGSNSSDPEGGRLSYLWDFGDGDTAIWAKGYHVYDFPLVYVVNLTVNDGELEDKAQIVLAVMPTDVGENRNHAPTANITYYPETPCAMKSIRFYSNAYDIDMNEISYRWDFDLRNGINITEVDSTISDPIWKYIEPGNYTVTLIVTDNGLPPIGNVSTINVNVSPSANCSLPPIVYPSGDETGIVGKPVKFYGYAIDPDGLGIVKYEWDFNGDSVYDWENSTSANTEYTFFSAGKYSPVLRATDADGAVGIGTHNVTITETPNIPPTVEISPKAINIYQGQVVEFHAEADDPDGDKNKLEYGWNFGEEEDGKFVKGSSIEKHRYMNEGILLVTVRVKDERNATGTDTSQVTVKKNRPPVANAGEDIAVNVGEPIYFDGSKSSDPDGDELIYKWDFDESDGIGVDATTVSPTHTYIRGGNYMVTLTVTDSFGNTAEDKLNVSVMQRYGLSITRNIRSQILYPDEITVYVLSISNIGNGIDDIKISVSGKNSKWATLEIDQFTLDSGKVREVGLFVKPPSDVLAGEKIVADIVTVSLYEPNTNAKTDILGTVAHVFNITLSMNKQKVSISPGGKTTMILTIYNQGNSNESVNIKVTGDKVDKWVTITPTSAGIPINSSVMITLEIKVPIISKSNEYSVVIWVISKEEKKVTTSFVLSIIPIRETPIFVFLLLSLFMLLFVAGTIGYSITRMRAFGVLLSLSASGLTFALIFYLFMDYIYGVIGAIVVAVLLLSVLFIRLRSPTPTF